MTEVQAERLVVAFEQISIALTGIHDTKKEELAKRFPERKEFREAVVTRIPTAEDLIRELHGGSDEPVQDWLHLPEEGGEWIGLREQEFLKSEIAATGAKAPRKRRPGGRSAEAAQSETRAPGHRAADHTDV